MGIGTPRALTFTTILARAAVPRHCVYKWSRSNVFPSRHDLTAEIKCSKLKTLYESEKQAAYITMDTLKEWLANKRKEGQCFYKWNFDVDNYNYHCVCGKSKTVKYRVEVSVNGDKWTNSLCQECWEFEANELDSQDPIEIDVFNKIRRYLKKPRTTSADIRETGNRIVAELKQMREDNKEIVAGFKKTCEELGRVLLLLTANTKDKFDLVISTVDDLQAKVDKKEQVKPL